MIQVTANEYVALPNINENDASIPYLTVLNMEYRGMLELDGTSLLKPTIKINNKEINLENKLSWTRVCYWIPKAEFENKDFKLSIIFLTPKDHKALAVRVSIENKSNKSFDFEISLNLNWLKTYHVVNESYEIKSEIIEKESNWNHAKVYQQFNKLPLISLAPMETNNSYGTLDVEEVYNYDYFLGVGYEEVSASTAAKHLKRIEFDELLKENVAFLESKIIRNNDSFLEMILNTNLFFSYYFSAGKTLDSEELVLATSRSPRYYVSAAYWDRDSLLWSYPSFLLIDEKLSKKVLEYVFTKQIKNIGEHSRFIDGSLLEPGFELDELCAPVLALEKYINKTGDNSILEESYLKSGLHIILEKLQTKRHKDIALYETFLMPTDDFTKEKYLTYNNVLVYKVLIILSQYLKDENLVVEAEKVKTAIYDYLVKDNMFVWSSDLNGHWSIYDEPPGSLQLLNFLGFCDKSSLIWNNTVNHIRSKDYKLSFATSNISEIGCAHAPHPWILSLCNSLLCGYGKSAIENLRKMKMDNFIACESVDEESGECVTGEAFATCAGFLAYSLYTYLNH
jgi:hypothetical protein